MNIREQIEEREVLLLSPYAAKSRDAIRDLEELFTVNVLDG